MGLRVGPAPLDIDSFGRCVTPPASPLVDLAAVTFVDAYGLVGVACLLRFLSEAGQSPVFLAPSDVAVSRYLARMHLQEIFDHCGVRIEGAPLPRVRELAGDDQLMAVQWFDNVADYDRLADLIWSRLAGQVDPQVLEALYEALQELGANVIEHSRSSGGYAAAQVFRKDSPHEYVVQAVGDLGIGVRESLMARYSPASDPAALALALRADVSASGEAGRGQGLPSTAQLVTGLGGRFLVHSGRGLIACRETEQQTQSVPYIPGTLVGARIPCRPS